MATAVNVHKVAKGTVEIQAGGRTIGTVSGNIFKTKVKKLVIERTENKETGLTEDKEVEKIVDGPEVDTLLEKAKCVVEWFAVVYNPQQFGPLQDITETRESTFITRS